MKKKKKVIKIYKDDLQNITSYLLSWAIPSNVDMGQVLNKYQKVELRFPKKLIITLDR